MDGVLQSILAALGGGVGIKLLEVLAKRGQASAEDAVAMRQELRLRVKELEDKIDLLRNEMDTRIQAEQGRYDVLLRRYLEVEGAYRVLKVRVDEREEADEAYAARMAANKAIAIRKEDA